MLYQTCAGFNVSDEKICFRIPLKTDGERQKPPPREPGALIFLENLSKFKKLASILLAREYKKKKKKALAKSITVNHC